MARLEFFIQKIISKILEGKLSQSSTALMTENDRSVKWAAGRQSRIICWISNWEKHWEATFLSLWAELKNNEIQLQVPLGTISLVREVLENNPQKGKAWCWIKSRSCVDLNWLSTWDFVVCKQLKNCWDFCAHLIKSHVLFINKHSC